MKKYLTALASLWLCASSTFLAAQSPAIDLVVPAGFTIETLDFSVPNARQMALTAQGTLIIGTRRDGRVYAIQNALTTDKPSVVELFSGLSMPSGVAIDQANLYIGALNEIILVPNIDQNIVANPSHRVITDTLPDKGMHGWKYLKFGPNGKLYVPVGAPCNVCLSEDARFASILQMDPATGSTQIWAHGIRNTVGFDWHPETGDLWFSDNGRDMLGDDTPAEEINISNAAGQHFGYPFVHAGDIPDPEFGSDAKADGLDFVAPRLKIQAHSAVLGMTFYDADQFPTAYRGALFAAEHGSWNRSEKVGYQVSVMHLDGDTVSYSPFVTGWLQGQTAEGRPNDVLVTPNGALLVSDDQRGVIYRVRYAP